MRDADRITLLQLEVRRLRDERNEARAIARVLAHAYTTDNRPPAKFVDVALAYPVEL